MNGIFDSKTELFSAENIIKMALILAIAIAAVIISLNFDMADVKNFIRQHQAYTVLIAISLYGILGFTPLPSLPITLFLSVLLGPLQAALIAATGNTLAAFFQYRVGQTVGDVVDFEEKKSRLPFGLGKIPIKSPLFMLIARSIPIGPRAFSMVCGAYEVPMGVYLWTTSIMYFLTSAVVSFGGTKLIQFL